MKAIPLTLSKPYIYNVTYQYGNIYKLKKTKAAKRILKTNVNNGNCDSTENTNKTVIHIP